ncbi:MAG TPA: molybdopterin cofactor-binding domain-containing protein, partial [Verrucomicrobiae bacterium]
MTTNDFLAANFRDIHSYEDFFKSDRRDFLKRVGGGIVIFMAINEALLGQEEAPRPRGGGRGGLPSDFNAFLRIGEDGHVTCYTGKIEMGQGPITSLPQMVAEELDAPLNTVDIVMGDTDLCPWDQGTFGSMTTRMFGPALRAAAAEARGVLLELAVDQLKVPQAQLVAKDGVISDQQDPKNKISYGQLAKGQKIERHLQSKAPLKDPAQFKISGKSQVRRDGEAKVTGKAHYAADIRVQGMLYAKILRPPAHGAKLKSVDTALAKAVAGVQVVQDNGLIAVLHEFPDVAEVALGKIKAEWDTPAATYDDKTVFDHLISVAPAPRNLARGGDLDEGKKNSAKQFDSTYLNAYVAHSPMEPHAALCQIEG